MMRRASPKAWVEASQAVETQLLGPFLQLYRPLAAPMLTIIMGIKKALTFPGPLVKESGAVLQKSEFPMPEPKITPALSLSDSQEIWKHLAWP